ncbi:MAG TPA: DUF1638 domain-containing protein [Anaerolineales bacterium]|nr:DUF1638 domain-containing protein [Anaerolineales bacterium]
MDHTHTLVIACATVMEEMQPLMPPGMRHQVFDFGLHVNPGQLRTALQAAIDAAAGQYDTIILGYGLCAQAMLGLRANGCRLVAPRVDDCIALFLGSQAAYRRQCQSEPGTYYLTKGWIEVGDTPFAEYDRMLARYGEQRARRIFRQMMGHYTRLALINTGPQGLGKYRQYAQQTAEKFGLRFEEIEGSDTLIQKMLTGPWDEDFVVLQAGETYLLEQFLPPAGSP